MSQRCFWAMLPTLMLLLVGCTPSLHPVYHQSDLVYEPKLLGVWTPAEGDEKDKETWTVTQSGEKAYKVVYVDKDGKRGQFTGHLAVFQELKFFDLYPDQPGAAFNDIYKLHLVPAHAFVLIRQIDPHLEVSILSPDWLKKQLEKDPAIIAHEAVDRDRVVLTASTTNLQNFLVKASKDPEAFKETARYVHPEAAADAPK